MRPTAGTRNWPATGGYRRANCSGRALSLDTLLGRPGRRVTCARCGEEVLNGREVALADGPVCPGCAGGAYYRWRE